MSIKGIDHNDYCRQANWKCFYPTRKEKEGFGTMHWWVKIGKWDEKEEFAIINSSQKVKRG